MSSRLSHDFPNPQPRPSTSTSFARPTSTYDPSTPYGHGSYGGYGDDQRPLHPLYHEGEDDRDDAFDVRADFDAEGPRWSERYGTAKSKADAASYRPVDDHVPPAPSGGTTKTTTSREELVSVPVLGPEWQKSELHDLSRRGRSEVAAEKRTKAWREWTRDQRGLCGVRWFTRRLLVFSLFFFCAALAVTLYFVIPRAPGFSFYVPSPFTVDNSTIAFSRSPTNYSFSGQLNLLADSSNSYLPVHFSDIQATLYDLSTDKEIATGNYGNHVVQKGVDQPVVLPVTFSYAAVNDSDTTWNDMYDACGHIWTGTTRPDLKFRLVLRMSIVGLVTHPETSAQLSDITCPFELSSTSV